MNPSASPSFWDDRYRQQNTPWNIGAPNPFLLDYIARFPKDSRILFPGAGHAHDAIHVFQELGYQKIWICDWSEAIIQQVRDNFPDFPSEQLLLQDFFTLQLDVDLVVEQTFLSAIPPSWRGRYVKKMHQLVQARQGRLGGLLFASAMNTDRPPYGGSDAIYRAIFSPYFHIQTLELAKGSIPPRLGNEFFFELSPLLGAQE